jgi:hypothetical protein
MAELFGEDPPPASLCGVPLTRFDADPRPLFQLVTTVDSPGSTGLDPITFSIPLSHRVVGAGWGTWSHGYAGDVYSTEGALEATVTLPARTRAFSLYAEPGPFQLREYEIIATDSAAREVVVRESIHGLAGARGFGFCAPRGELLTVLVRSTDRFAIGEFGIIAALDCEADCDGTGALDFFDFLCFQGLFSAGDPAADCDGDGELTLFDFLCFQNAFVAGCP